MSRFTTTRRNFLAGTAIMAATSLPPLRAAASSDTVVTISSPWGSNQPFQKVVDVYNAKKTGVRAVNRMDGDYQEMAAKALASVASGHPPEMMITGWKFGYFAHRTLGARDFNEIDATRARAIIDRFKPSVRPLVTIDKALIGLPWALSTPVTWINMNLWREAGLDDNIPFDVTHTWLMKQAARIDKALGGRNHPTYRSAMDLSNNEWTSQAYIQNAGGFILDGDKVVCDSPAAIKGMTRFAEPVRAGLWTNMDSRAQHKAMFAGNIAIVATSSSRAAAAAKSDIEFKDIMFPSLGGHRNMNSGGNFIAIYTHDNELAKASMDFLAFCASREGQEIWSEGGYLNCSIHDIAPKPLQEAACAQLQAGLTPETIWPGARGLEGQDVWRQWVTRILDGQVQPVEGLASARKDLAQLVTS